MMHLLYYEIRRTRAAKLAIAGAALALEAVFLIGVRVNSSSAMGLSGLLLFLLALGGTMAAGLSSVLLLHRDLTTQEGYMLFLTPRRCWSILGAKMLECLISLILCVGFFAALVYLDVLYLFRYQDQLQAYWRLATEFLADPTAYLQRYTSFRREFPIRMDLRDGTMILCAFIAYVATWESYMATASFSVILAQTFFPGRRRGVITAFLFFAVIAYVIHWGQSRLPVLDPYQHSLLLAAALALAESAVMYLAAAPIMQRRFSI